MSITVYGIRPASGGFGEYERAGDGESYGSIGDYIDACMDAHPGQVERIAEDDPRILAMDGMIHRQNGGTIVGWQIDGLDPSFELVIED